MFVLVPSLHDERVLIKAFWGCRSRACGNMVANRIGNRFLGCVLTLLHLSLRDSVNSGSMSLLWYSPELEIEKSIKTESIPFFKLRRRGRRALGNPPPGAGSVRNLVPCHLGARGSRHKLCHRKTTCILAWQMVVVFHVDATGLGCGTNFTVR